MRFFHTYTDDTVFGERSGLFVNIGWQKWWRIQGVHLILKLTGFKKRKFDVDFGDRVVFVYPVWWVRLSYIRPYDRHWIKGDLRIFYGVGARSDGTFAGI